MLVQILSEDYDGQCNYGVFNTKCELTEEFVCRTVREYLKERIPEFSCLIEDFNNYTLKDEYFIKRRLFKLTSSIDDDHDDYYERLEVFDDLYSHVEFKWINILIEKGIVEKLDMPEFVINIRE